MFILSFFLFTNICFASYNVEEDCFQNPIRFSPYAQYILPEKCTVFQKARTRLFALLNIVESLANMQKLAKVKERRVSTVKQKQDIYVEDKKLSQQFKYPQLSSTDLRQGVLGTCLKREALLAARAALNKVHENILSSLSFVARVCTEDDIDTLEHCEHPVYHKTLREALIAPDASEKHDAL